MHVPGVEQAAPVHTSRTGLPVGQFVYSQESENFSRANFYKNLLLAQESENLITIEKRQAVHVCAPLAHWYS